MGKTHDGFSSSGYFFHFDTDFIMTVRICHGNRTIIYIESICSALPVMNRFLMLPGKGKRINDLSVDPDFHIISGSPAGQVYDQAQGDSNYEQ